MVDLIYGMSQSPAVTQPLRIVPDIAEIATDFYKYNASVA